MPWPYNEGLTLAEATNPLAFLATGMYGHPLLKQHGAPVRLVVPWKYGFKSRQVDRPHRADRRAAGDVLEHARAAASTTSRPTSIRTSPTRAGARGAKRMLGSGERRPSVIYNGYGEWVAKLYA